MADDHCVVCEGFTQDRIKLARNHVKRVHIMHLQCEKCGQRFGGTFERRRHISKATCKPTESILNVPKYVTDYAERINSCSTIGELNQATHSGSVNLKLYDASQKIDNIIIAIAFELMKSKGPIGSLGNPLENPESIIWAYSQIQLQELEGNNMRD